MIAGVNAELIVYLAALAAAGAAAGFLGGLFGVGGGVILVPALFHLFGAMGAPDAVRAHAAVATSLSTIIATSWRSLAAHRAAGAVDASVLRAWTPWIALGAAVGAAAAGASSGRILLAAFGFAALAIAAQMALGPPPRLGRELPRGAARACLGGGLGLASAMMGIGGGAFGVTLMTMFGRPLHQAVATASGFGMAIAAPAALGYVAVGWGAAGLPPGSLGYVNLPGFLALAALTAVTAPLGARLAHRLPQQRLRLGFAAFLALTALNLLGEAFS